MFNIGDKVIYIFDDKKYEIIGSVAQPYNRGGLPPVVVPTGYDFILKEISSTKEFSPFKYVNKEHLEPFV